MTRVIAGHYAAPTDGSRFSLWYLVNPTTGVNRRVLAATSASTTWEIACTSYTGVDQTTPFGNTAFNNGSTGSATLNVFNSVDGSFPVAHLASTNVGYVAGAGVTDRQSASASEIHYLVDGNTLVAAFAGHNFNWTYSGQWVGFGFMLRPAVP
jgi:hypothetical protein